MSQGRRNLDFTAEELNYINSKFNDDGEWHPFAFDEVEESRYCDYDYLVKKCYAPAWYSSFDDPKALNLIRKEYYRPLDFNPYSELYKEVPLENMLDDYAGCILSHIFYMLFEEKRKRNRDTESYEKLKKLYDKSLHTTNEQWMILLKNHRDRVGVKSRAILV